MQQVSGPQGSRCPYSAVLRRQETSQDRFRWLSVELVGASFSVSVHFVGVAFLRVRVYVDVFRRRVPLRCNIVKVCAAVGGSKRDLSFLKLTKYVFKEWGTISILWFHAMLRCICEPTSRDCLGGQVSNNTCQGCFFLGGRECTCVVRTQPTSYSRFITSKRHLPYLLECSCYSCSIVFPIVQDPPSQVCRMPKFSAG